METIILINQKISLEFWLRLFIRLLRVSRQTFLECSLFFKVSWS